MPDTTVGLRAPAPPFAPAAVVFDLDGLLIDSEPVWGRAERRVVTELGRRWDPSIQRALLGRGPADAARVLAELVGGADPDDVDRRLLAAALDEFRRGLAPRPGALALVDGLRGRVPLAVATNSRRVLADAAVTSCGLADVFDALVCAEDVDAAKPAPDPYLAASEALGAHPSRAVGFEDSPVGVASAKAAGLWVVACPSFDGEDLSDADAVVGSLANVDPVTLGGG